MSEAIGKPERATQDRVIALFTEQLGYRYLGNCADRAGNHCIDEGLLTAHLVRQGYRPAHISAALHRLQSEALLHGRTLYAANQAVYQLLRYGVAVKVAAGEASETVHLVHWDRPADNDFAIAEEVTLKGGHERRPDIVLYLNGIAVGVLELKNSRIGLGEGIRQCLSNQQPEFNDWFFSTVQLVLAGNDSEGLRYGTIGTQEKYFLAWKEDEADNAGYKLDKYLAKLCSPHRLLELMHDFVLFDGGVKKLPRVHQYFGLKAAQANVQQRRGGIIWHTQGAGKSILMVLLARWILENRPAARVAIITDRDELDRQIERVFKEAGEAIHRSQSGRDLVAQLAQPNPRLLCSLVHKFGRRDVVAGREEFEAFIRELAAQPSPTQGEIYVFVDECHRTQGGKLHRLMKAMSKESHYLWGKRYLLEISHVDAAPKVKLSPRKLNLQVRPDADQALCEEVLDAWYRQQVRNAVPALLGKWEPLLAVKTNRVFVQRMKTKWGSCTPSSGNVRLNTDLAKKPSECLEYILVHELMHLLEPTHSQRFITLMDLHLPHWRELRSLLNHLPVRHEKWSY